jgi:hypothetical protein
MIESLNKVIAQLEQLPEAEQERIAQIILKEVERDNLPPLSSACFSLENQPFGEMWKDRKEINSSLPKGVKGEVLNAYGGMIPQDDLQLMSQAISEGCDVIDEHEW